MSAVVLLREPLSFLSSALHLDVATLDHHDLAQAVVLVVVVEAVDRVGPEALTEGSLAHLSTRLEVPRINPKMMKATIVWDALRWDDRI